MIKQRNVPVLVNSYSLYYEYLHPFYSIPRMDTICILRIKGALCFMQLRLDMQVWLSYHFLKRILISAAIHV